jgi:hypothetical protein
MYQKTELCVKTDRSNAWKKDLDYSGYIFR